MSERLENKDIVTIFLKWKKVLAVILIASAILSAVFSSPYFIQPKYKSLAVIYPVNISTFGSESEVEQALQTLRSDDIKATMIDEFHLVEHYELDAGLPAIGTIVRREFEENVNISKTEFESIEIEVYDKKPERALAMAERIIELYNAKILYMRRDKTREVMMTIKHQMEIKAAESDSLEKQVSEMRMKYGLLDYGVQTQEVLRGYYRGMSEPGFSTKEAQQMEEVINNLKQHGGSFVEKSEKAWRARNEFLDLKNQFENARKDMEREQSFANIISKPLLPDKKAYPVRWLIVLVTTLASIFFTFLVIVWLESYRNDEL
ncbi:MAG: hypothetical protein KDD36_09395 [Flavobacteriales bacterium]|nr:hypothetical protein [Flavobacteriales bacterium]